MNAIQASLAARAALNYLTGRFDHLASQAAEASTAITAFRVDRLAFAIGAQREALSREIAATSLRERLFHAVGAQRQALEREVAITTQQLRPFRRAGAAEVTTRQLDAATGVQRSRPFLRGFVIPGGA